MKAIVLEYDGLKAAGGFASKDVTRLELAAVCVEENGDIVATDGHRLVHWPSAGAKVEDHPIPDLEGRKDLAFPILLSADDCKAILKVRPKGKGELEAVRNRFAILGTENGTGVQAAIGWGNLLRLTPFGGTYPNWRGVVPDYSDPEKREFQIALDGEYAASILALAKVAAGQNGMVLFRFGGSQKPVTFEVVPEGGNAERKVTGVLMPLRLPEEG